jgi:hypothetical protein
MMHFWVSDQIPNREWLVNSLFRNKFSLHSSHLVELTARMSWIALVFLDCAKSADDHPNHSLKIEERRNQRPLRSGNRACKSQARRTTAEELASGRHAEEYGE